VPLDLTTPVSLPVGAYPRGAPSDAIIPCSRRERKSYARAQDGANPGGARSSTEDAGLCLAKRSGRFGSRAAGMRRHFRATGGMLRVARRPDEEAARMCWGCRYLSQHCAESVTGPWVGPGEPRVLQHPGDHLQPTEQQLLPHAAGGERQGERRRLEDAGPIGWPGPLGRALGDRPKVRCDEVDRTSEVTAVQEQQKCADDVIQGDPWGVLLAAPQLGAQAQAEERKERLQYSAPGREDGRCPWMNHPYA